MKFTHYYLGHDDHSSHDDYNCHIYDTINGEEMFIGHCKYYKKDFDTDIVFIEYISIKEQFRRNGYATNTVKELQSKYNLQWDYRFTLDGRMWYESLVKKKVVTVI